MLDKMEDDRGKLVTILDFWKSIAIVGKLKSMEQYKSHMKTGAEFEVQIKFLDFFIVFIQRTSQS